MRAFKQENKDSQLLHGAKPLLLGIKNIFHVQQTKQTPQGSITTGWEWGLKTKTVVTNFDEHKTFARWHCTEDSIHRVRGKGN
nr:hypothetical protein [uncultured Pseudodesulfovibrio sp.]